MDRKTVRRYAPPSTATWETAIRFSAGACPTSTWVDARHDGGWELPVLGRIDPPAGVVVRPDGYVAWAGDLADPGLPRALVPWFGPGTPA